MPDTPPTLLNRLRDHQDRHSWQRFFDGYWRLIYAYAVRQGLAPEDAEDIVQEVVTDVFRLMPQFNYDRSRGTFRAYLRTITHNRIIDHCRRQARRPTINLEHPADNNGRQPVEEKSEPAANQFWEKNWQRNLLQLCLDRVRGEVEPKTFQAFQLYALEGWAAKETAEFLKMTVDSVYAAKSRVTQRVRRSFDSELKEDKPA